MHWIESQGFCNSKRIYSRWLKLTRDDSRCTFWPLMESNFSRWPDHAWLISNHSSARSRWRFKCFMLQWHFLCLRQSPEFQTEICVNNKAKKLRTNSPHKQTHNEGIVQRKSQQHEIKSQVSSLCVLILMQRTMCGDEKQVSWRHNDSQSTRTPARLWKGGREVDQIRQKSSHFRWNFEASLRPSIGSDDSVTKFTFKQFTIDATV